MPKVKRDWIRFRDPIEDRWMPSQQEMDTLDEGQHEFYLTLEGLLKSHFQCFPISDRLDYSWMAHHLCYDQAHALDHFWSTQETQENLAKLKAHITSLVKLWKELPFPVQEHFRSASLHRTGVLGVAKNGDPWQRDPNDRIINHPSYHAYLAALNFFDWHDVFLEVFPDVVNKADQGISLGKKSLDAWRLVAASAALCERIPDTIKVPRYMNESGPFYRLLSDLFHLFEIDELPTSAFRGWRKHVGHNT